MKTKLLLTFLFTSLFLNAQSISDPNFERYLETHDGEGNVVGLGSQNSLGDGVMNNGAIDNFNVSRATVLNLSNLNINNLEGINSFNDLIQLFVSGNNLTSLDVSDNTRLQVLACSSNRISNLNLTSNTRLNVVFCNNNNIDTLILPNEASSFNTLNCSNNNLTSLDISPILSITSLVCSSNNLTMLNAANGRGRGGNSNFRRFEVNNNPNLRCIQIDDINRIGATWVKDDNAIYSENCIISIPDSNFEQALIDLGHDDSIDGMVAVENINSVTSLNIPNKNISDLTGIEGFTALEFLGVNDNNLTTVDLSNNTSLNNLSIFRNQLIALDVSSNTSLFRINCDFNRITALDLSLNTSLRDIACGTNNLTMLNVKNGNNANVTFFVANNNPDLQCVEVDDASNPRVGTGAFFIDSNVIFSENCSTSLSVNELEELTFSLYPNPSKGSVSIDVLEKATLIVYTFTGKEVLKRNLFVGKNQLNDLNISTGMYLFKVVSQSKSSVKKVFFN